MRAKREFVFSVSNVEVPVAAERLQNVAPGASPGFVLALNSAPGGAKDAAQIFRPFRGSASPDRVPRACARGDVLKPLRGGNSIVSNH